ncbi:hypothetical protein BDR07DRAFT_1384718 [Suillus spraguei]|nr:hypothetical protein BDR07DRAFT_1384718 [Suillus spraguei]
MGAIDPVTEMHILKRAKHANGAPVGDIVPLSQLRAFIHIIPQLGPVADVQLMKANSTHYHSSFFLNKVDGIGSSACSNRADSLKPPISSANCTGTTETHHTSILAPTRHHCGHTISTVKGLLKSELDDKVIDESDLKKMKFTTSIFHLQHINKIKYHKKDGSSVYIQKKWNFNWRKKSKMKDSESIDTDATDLIDSDEEVEGLNSHGSTIFSQGTNGTWSDDKYKGSGNTGSKRK